MIEALKTKQKKPSTDKLANNVEEISQEVQQKQKIMKTEDKIIRG